MNVENNSKGIILVFETPDEDIYFEYKPLDICEENYNNWKKEKIENTSNKMIKEIYWKLEVISCILVLRNRFWFNQVLPIINNFWKIINIEKKEGYEHRAPKKRPIKSNTICLIDQNLFT